MRASSQCISASPPALLLCVPRGHQDAASIAGRLIARVDAALEADSLKQATSVEGGAVLADDDGDISDAEAGVEAAIALAGQRIEGAGRQAWAP